MTPYYQDDWTTIYHGDCREIIPTLDPVDLVLTDPPYSSGGLMRSDRNLSTSAKYRLSTGIKHPNFSGDNRDQRSFEKWCGMWLSDCYRITKAGGCVGVFIDWRNIACLVDAIQIAGWVYRGLVVWNKKAGRPVLGWFAGQHEFCVMGSSGAIARDASQVSEEVGICQRGILNHSTESDKQHQTQKPVELLKDIIRTRNDWQTILDPFMGSGSTLLAAKELNKQAIGIEIEERYCEIAARRLQQEVFNFAPVEETQPEQLLIECT